MARGGKARGLRLLRKHIHMLTLYAKATPAEASELARYLPEEVLDELCTCLYNAMNTMPIPSGLVDEIKQRTHADKGALKWLANAKRSKRRRKVVMQTGGSIIAILSAVLPLVISLLTK